VFVLRQPGKLKKKLFINSQTSRWKNAFSLVFE